MAGGITDREEDRFVFRARFRESLFAPGKPIDRIVRVLEEVRRFFPNESVGVLDVSGRNFSGWRGSLRHVRNLAANLARREMRTAGTSSRAEPKAVEGSR